MENGGKRMMKIVIHYRHCQSTNFVVAFQSLQLAGQKDAFFYF